MADLSPDQARALLSEVITRGAPAQADYARAIAQRWDRIGTDEIPAEIRDEIDLIARAHLHDPYLTRREPGADLET